MEHNWLRTLFKSSFNKDSQSLSQMLYFKLVIKCTNCTSIGWLGVCFESVQIRHVFLYISLFLVRYWRVCFLLSFNISWSASASGPVSAVRPGRNYQRFGLNCHWMLPGPRPGPGTVTRLGPGPRSGSWSGAGPIKMVLTLSYKRYLSNLERESLRLLGLRDLDLERDLPPLPSSYSLILNQSFIIF